MNSDSSTLTELEEAGLNAWPALEQRMCDGWVMQSAAGYTRRANSVQPLYPGSRSLYAKVLDAERWYRARGLNPTFRLTEASHPAGLDSVLADRGYRKEAPTSVQWARLDDLVRGFADGSRCAIWDGPVQEWFDAYVSVQKTPEKEAGILRSILNRRAKSGHFNARFFGTVVEGGEHVSVGMAILEGPWVGLFGLATRSGQRGRGFCRKLIEALVQSARAAGADRAYLQVEVTNDPALGLYARLGFREVYRYWYRKVAGERSAG